MMLLKVLWVISLVAHSVSQDAQNFTYSQFDSIVVLPSSSFGIYGSLTTTADEYLSASYINITNQIEQVGDNKQNYAQYNIYYFNLTSDQGMTCYQNWVLGASIPNQSNCPSLTYLSQQKCHNYSNCLDEHIFYSLALEEWQSVQHIFYVHNVHPSNQLNLKTKLSAILISSNTWFFWAVGLTCLLMIMIVVLTGIVFNLNIKMSSTKKVYEQYKLTLQNEIDFVLRDGNQTKQD